MGKIKLLKGNNSISIDRITINENFEHLHTDVDTIKSTISNKNVETVSGKVDNESTVPGSTLTQALESLKDSVDNTVLVPGATGSQGATGVGATGSVGATGTQGATGNSISNTIYTANDTIGTDRILTITDKLSFRESLGVNNVFKIFETGDVLFGSSSGGINSKFFANGNVALGGDTIISGAAGITLHKNTLIKAESDSQNVLNIIDTSSSGIFQVKGNGTCILGGNSLVSTEKISLQSSTAIKGNGTSTGSALAIYNNDTTPVKLWDFLDNGNLNLGVDSTITGNRNSLLLKSTNTLLGYTDASSNLVNNLNMNINDFQIDVNVDFELRNINNISKKPIVVNMATDNVLKLTTIGVTLGNPTDDAIFINAGSYGLIRNNTYRHRVNDTETYMGNKTIISPTYTESFIGSEDISLQGDTLLNANVNMPNLPTSATGLSSGDLWNDGGTLKIV